MSRLNVLFLTRYGRLGASSRMRLFQFLPWLESEGVDCTVIPFFTDTQLASRYVKCKYALSGLLASYNNRLISLLQAKRYDLVWIQKEALPWFPAWFEKWLLREVPYVLDFDDAIFHNYDLHPSSLVRKFWGQRVDHLMAGAQLVISGNKYLAQRAIDAGARWSEILPTVVDLEKYPVKHFSDNAPELIKIVWIGSPSTTRYLTILSEPLAELNQLFNLELHVIGGKDFELGDVNTKIIKWSEETEATSIRTCDIGVMPLTDSPWERGKCGYKLIQYMACGLPVVASPVGVNCEIVRCGENGYLADTADEWIAALSILLKDAKLRQQMGRSGRKRVEEGYSVQQISYKFLQLLRCAGKN